MRFLALLHSALLALLALAALPALLGAQAPAASTDSSRARLALALLRLEYALRDRPAAESAQAGISRAFDAATLRFFAGQMAPAERTIDSLAATVEPDPARRAAHDAAARRTLAAADGDRLTLTTPSGTTIPWRVRVPPGASPAPRPLLIALHGAGGDERMWLEAYGAGMLASLAAREGMVVATPLTTAMRDPAALAALVDAVAARTPIDRRRVYLLGHSLGGATAWMLAQRASAGTVRAVACLAAPCGAPAPGDSTTVLPPLFLAAGALDPLAPPARLQPGADAARAAGRLGEFRIVADRGHTLMVAAVLGDALRWLAGAQ